ncbi:hypothetical protein [Aquisalibacillus elongatus]|uniref:Uncharacterized protein n=1 Tax=Aquisalibacillus elongatus TaxID=485577 RepID=A0A3N5BPN0_9BACI|nr:hypothetical protein [Aquisalibacillus elongatus]RPF57030.1 hypothetical protein EDC24_0078 [Aquisalibacillus elongatus]
MKNILLLITILIGMGMLLPQSMFAEEENLPECTITIESAKHDDQNKAIATKPCGDEVRGFYASNVDSFLLTGASTGHVKENGEKHTIYLVNDDHPKAILTVYIKRNHDKEEDTEEKQDDSDNTKDETDNDSSDENTKDETDDDSNKEHTKEKTDDDESSKKTEEENKQDDSNNQDHVEQDSSSQEQNNTSDNNKSEQNKEHEEEQNVQEPKQQEKQGKESKSSEEKPKEETEKNDENSKEHQYINEHNYQHLGVDSTSNNLKQYVLSKSIIDSMFGQSLSVYLLNSGVIGTLAFTYWWYLSK